MVSLEAFSELLQILYSAPLQQELWERFLTRACEFTHSSLGAFIAADTSTGVAVQAHAGMRDYSATIVAYNGQYGQRDPFRSAILRSCRTCGPEGVYLEEELIPSRELLRTEMYSALLAPENLRYAAITVLACTVRRLDVISLWRTPEQGPASSSVRRVLELLIPHVQTALKIQRALGAAEGRLANTEAMANASPTAMFALSSDGRIQHANTAAAALVADGDVLRVTNGRLTAVQADARVRLAGLLRDAVCPSYASSSSTACHALSLHGPHGQCLQVLAAALPESRREESRADLLLLVSNPNRPISFPDCYLRELYRFSPAEIEVANGLLMGHSPEEIACLRRVATSTVRQQIKSMLDKTETSRQSEMVRLLMTLPQLRQ